MDFVSLIVPALYAAALTWALSGDFLRAQFQKDLERDSPAVLGVAWKALSLPTVCLVGALVLRLLVHVEGLLLTALLVAAASALWKTHRVGLLRAPAPVAGRTPLH